MHVFHSGFRCEAHYGAPSPHHGICHRSTPVRLLEPLFRDDYHYADLCRDIGGSFSLQRHELEELHSCRRIGKWPCARYRGFGSTAYIYAATSNGLSTFNGSSWSNITTGLASNTVNRVFLGSSYLYAATSGGLSIYNGSSWSTATTGSASSVTNDVFVSGESTYAATGSGLFVSRGGVWSQFTSTGAPTGPVAAVFIDAAGDIYSAAGTAGGIKVSYNGGTSWTTVTAGAGSIPSNNVLSLFVDTSYNIYVGTDAGLAIYSNSGGYWTRYNVANGLAGDSVNGVFVAGSTICAATSGGLSVSKDGGSTWTTYTTANGLGSNQVNGVYVTPPLYSY